jgi:DNA-binding NarL/FixJ family response regulator
LFRCRECVSNPGRATLYGVGEPIRLFLVSRAVAIRRALAQLLDADADITVVGEARTSTEAIARVPAARPQVVLAGAHLHNPESPEMCLRLRAALPGVQVLMVGFNPSRELVVEAINAGAAGILPYTTDEQELLEAIETAAAGRMVVSTELMMDILRRDREPAAPDLVATLTPLEKELFGLVGEGMSNAEIAREMRLSPGTVRNYVSRLLRKLEVERRAQVVVLAAQRVPAGVPQQRPRSAAVRPTS